MTARRRIVRVLQGSDPGLSADAGGDELTVEAPLNLVVAGEVIATLMRTPGHDLELASGRHFPSSLEVSIGPSPGPARCKPRTWPQLTAICSSYERTYDDTTPLTRSTVGPSSPIDYPPPICCSW